MQRAIIMVMMRLFVPVQGRMSKRGRRAVHRQLASHGSLGQHRDQHEEGKGLAHDVECIRRPFSLCTAASWDSGSSLRCTVCCYIRHCHI